jgi:hypothetical protein
VNEYQLLQMWEDFMLAQGRSEKTLQLYRYALMRLASETRPAKPLPFLDRWEVWGPGPSTGPCSSLAMRSSRLAP